jgi:hypothetical protein
LDEPVTLEPVEYERIPEGGWRVPLEERERWDAPLLRPDPPKVRAELEDARERDPFGCPGCGRRLSNGKRFCSAACFLKAKAHMT